ncbi:hypothetical protein [Citrobacter werkmanii]|nr:hypothetical protein [Citrobacter werkmanii]
MNEHDQLRAVFGTACAAAHTKEAGGANTLMVRRVIELLISA